MNKKQIIQFESKVKQNISKYKMINKKDKVIVALSGGKDSTTVLYLLKKLNYNVEGLMIDLYLGDWSKKHRNNMENFCRQINVKLNIMDLKKEFGQGICFIKGIVKQKKGLTGCTVCGITKKWILNKWARELKADKIATGHNLDDETQTVLMNFLKGNLFLGINSTPMTGDTKNARKYGFVQRIKPLFFTPESEIREYSKTMKFPVLYEKCPCAFGTYRVETRNWIHNLNLNNKQKLKIVNNFQKIIPELRKTEEKTEIKKCKTCGEPSRGEVCNACKIFSCMKEV